MLTRLASLLLLATASLVAGAAVPASAPAYGVRLEKTWIPMKDGVRLAVTLYMPANPKPGDRFPDKRLRDMARSSILFLWTSSLSPAS